MKRTALAVVHVRSQENGAAQIGAERTVGRGMSFRASGVAAHNACRRGIARVIKRG